MALRDRQGANKVQVQDLEAVGREGQILEWCSGVAGHFGLLARKTLAAQATDIRRDITPNKAPLDIRHSSVGALMSQSMDAVENTTDPGAGNQGTPMGSRDVAQDRPARR